MVCKPSSQTASAPLTSSEYVECARAWADDIVWRECEGPGDLVEARRRVEARYGIPATFLRDLRYRPPKRIAVELYERLRSAYLNQCGLELKRFEKALAEASSCGRHEGNSALVRTAIAVARAAGRKEDEG